MNNGEEDNFILQKSSPINILQNNKEILSSSPNSQNSPNFQNSCHSCSPNSPNSQKSYESYFTATTKPLPIILKDILQKLEILSEIREGQKLNIADMTYCEANSWWSSITRRYMGESRENLIFHLENIINQAIASIEEFKNSEFASILVKSLYKSKTGVENLAKTYKEDPNTFSKIKIILTNIEIQLTKNSEILQRYRFRNT